MAVLLARRLRTVSDHEARVAGELIVSLRDDLHDEFFANELAAGGQAIEGVSFVELLTTEYSFLRGPCVVRVSAGVPAHDLRWSAPVLVWLSATCKAPSTA
jgi:hypothetical protein